MKKQESANSVLKRGVTLRVIPQPVFFDWIVVWRVWRQKQQLYLKWTLPGRKNRKTVIEYDTERYKKRSFIERIWKDQRKPAFSGTV
jgi:hypothetical protein